MILNRQRKVRVAAAPLERFLERVRREMGIERSDVTVCLVSNAEIARLNETYRRKRGPTDVLAFPARAASGLRSRGRKRTTRRNSGTGFLGDIAIAPETARKYAQRNDRQLLTELRVLILHGVLHLLGYDHESDAGEMDRVEQRLRRRLGLE